MAPEELPPEPPLDPIEPLLDPPPSADDWGPMTHVCAMQTRPDMQSADWAHDSPNALECWTALLFVVLHAAMDAPSARAPAAMAASMDAFMRFPPIRS
jgi:hypothetical protein